MSSQNHQPRISRQAFLRTLAFAAPLLSGIALMAKDEPHPVAPASRPVWDSDPDAANLRAFIELARSDLRTRKSVIFARNLPLTEAEAMEFWPLQREYDTAFNKLLDERLALIIQFSNDYGTMTDPQAKALAKASFELEEKRTALKKKYFARFCKVIPAVKAARFFQIENQLNMAIDLRVAASLPLIK
jgi:hypothetical protein